MVTWNSLPSEAKKATSLSLINFINIKFNLSNLKLMDYVMLLDFLNKTFK